MNKWFYRAVGTVGIAGIALLSSGAAQAAPHAGEAPVLRGMFDDLFKPGGGLSDLGLSHLGVSVDAPGKRLSAGLVPGGPVAMGDNDGQVGVTAHVPGRYGVPQDVFVSAGRASDLLAALPVTDLLPVGEMGRLPESAGDEELLPGLPLLDMLGGLPLMGFPAGGGAPTLGGMPLPELPILSGGSINSPVQPGAGGEGILGLPLVDDLKRGALPAVGKLGLDKLGQDGAAIGLDGRAPAKPSPQAQGSPQAQASPQAQSATQEDLPLVGGLLSGEGGTLGGLPVVGGLAGGDALGGLPVVGDLAGPTGPLSGLPVVGGLTSGDPLGGLPVVGGLVGKGERPVQDDPDAGADEPDADDQGAEDPDADDPSKSDEPADDPAADDPSSPGDPIIDDPDLVGDPGDTDDPDRQADDPDQQADDPDPAATAKATPRKGKHRAAPVKSDARPAPARHPGERPVATDAADDEYAYTPRHASEELPVVGTLPVLDNIKGLPIVGELGSLPIVGGMGGGLPLIGSLFGG